MSAAAPLRRPAALRLPAPSQPAAIPKPATRPRLTLVSQRRTPAGRLPFLILVGGVLCVGLVCVLLLHMVAAQDAYRANAMQQRLATLTDREQQLETTLDAGSAPAVLRQRAVALGMRPTTVTSFRRLKDGRAIGVQTPVALPPPPSTTTTAKTTKPDATTKPGATAKSGATAKPGTATKSGGKTGATAKPRTAGTTAPGTHHHKAATRP